MMGLELIQQLKKEKGYTTEQLSTLSGVPVGTLNKILNGSTKDPKFETLRALSRVLGCSLDALDEGIPNAFNATDTELLARYRNSPYQQAINHLLHFNTTSTPSYSIMLYDLLYLPQNGKFLDNEPYEILQVPYVPAETHFAVRLAGLEMEPLYFNRQVVYFQRTSQLLSGDCGLFMLDKKIYFRTYRYQNGNMFLEGGNSDISSISITSEMDLTIIGKALTPPVSH